jgi:cytochrome c oxidase subunit 2
MPHRRASAPAGLVRALAPTAACLVAVGALGGCGGRSPSTLAGDGPKGSDVATAWWLLFTVAAVMCVVVIVMAVLPLVLRRQSRADADNARLRFVGVWGVAMPGVILAAVFALSLRTLTQTSSPPTPPRVTIDVIGHQWWWEFRYAGTSAVTANEVHVPVGVPVELRLSTADVIHSFWVPQLSPKTDLIPKKVNTTWLTASRPGTFRGECAEFCGAEHGFMDFRVVAEPQSRFRSWLDAQAQPATTPTSSLARRGMSLVTTTTCASCHTVRGTPADGRVGPDLTHVGSRPRLGGGVISNTPEHLAAWIANPQLIKPGIRMPPQPLDPAELRAVVAYLEGLR